MRSIAWCDSLDSVYFPLKRVQFYIDPFLYNISMTVSLRNSFPKWLSIITLSETQSSSEPASYHSASLHEFIFILLARSELRIPLYPPGEPYHRSGMTAWILGFPQALNLAKNYRKCYLTVTSDLWSRRKALSGMHAERAKPTKKQ